MRQYIYSTLKGFQALNRKFEIKFTLGQGRLKINRKQTKLLEKCTPPSSSHNLMRRVNFSFKTVLNDLHRN